MAKKDQLPEELRQGEAVVAAVALPGIPEGTRGRVVFATGFTWVRYWIRFDNGVIRGSLHRDKLARPAEWIDIQARRARGDQEPATETVELVAAGGGNGSSPDAAGGDAKVVNGVPVPEHLIERSRARRAALGK